jgi:hypothetical protein
MQRGAVHQALMTTMHTKRPDLKKVDGDAKAPIAEEVQAPPVEISSPPILEVVIQLEYHQLVASKNKVCCTRAAREMRCRACRVRRQPTVRGASPSCEAQP